MRNVAALLLIFASIGWAQQPGVKRSDAEPGAQVSYASSARTPHQPFLAARRTVIAWGSQVNRWLTPVLCNPCQTEVSLCDLLVLRGDCFRLLLRHLRLCLKPILQIATVLSPALLVELVGTKPDLLLKVDARFSGLRGWFYRRGCFGCGLHIVTPSQAILFGLRVFHQLCGLNLRQEPVPWH
jgi:hypothetical protein